jgi:hypothetical protein
MIAVALRYQIHRSIRYQIAEPLQAVLDRIGQSSSCDPLDRESPQRRLLR